MHSFVYRHSGKNKILVIAAADLYANKCMETMIAAAMKSTTIR